MLSIGLSKACLLHTVLRHEKQRCVCIVSLVAADEALDRAAHPIKRIRTRPLRSANIMQDSENWYAGMSGTKRCRTRPLMDRTQRKEVHNRKERDRRWALQTYCLTCAEIT